MMTGKRRFASGWLVGLLLTATIMLLAAGPLTGAWAAPAQQTYPTGVVLNEFMPNPASDWDGNGQFSESDDEYMELYNRNAFVVDISGWKLDDAANLETSPYILPPNTLLQPGQHLVFFGSQTGVGLNNTADAARLLYPDDQVADEYVYPNTANDVPYSRTTDGIDDWTTTYPPSPGASNQPAATPTATPTPTPAVYPAGVVLNEFMPNPLSDWNGDGATGDSNDEYIELYNLNEVAVDLTGWLVDDADGGSTPYRLPAGSAIAAHGFLTLWSRDTGIGLNNSGGDAVRLLTPDGGLRDTTTYTVTSDDLAYSRDADGVGAWVSAYPPSPNASNQPPPPTSTPTLTSTPTETPTATTTPTSTPTFTPVVYPSNIALNEFMPNPLSDWNGDGATGDSNDEYIELYNLNEVAVDLTGWLVDDADGGSTPYRLPAGSVIAAHGFLTLWSRDTGIGLNNSGGDAVRLLTPDGALRDTTTYTVASDDLAYSRDADGVGAWVSTYSPSPNASNQPAPTPTPTATATVAVYPAYITLNEFMPDPAADWNGDGAANEDDEYIELYNGNANAVDVSGWRLDDMDDGLRAQPEGSAPYTLPAGSMISAHGFLLVFASESNLALNNGGDWVRLLRPDGVVVEAFAYTASRDDEAYSKTVDGGDGWTRTYPPSPGASNQAAPTVTPTPTVPPTTGRVSGHVFIDANQNGRFEPWLGDQGLGGVLVMLGTLRSRLSGPDGWYGFANVPPGVYAVREAQPVHTTSTTPDEVTVTVAAGDLHDSVHFGELPLPAAQIQSPVLLNEFLPAPASDWNGDGTANTDDEWIELFNHSANTVDVSGWWLDDVDEGGSAAYLLPAGTNIAPHGFLLVYRAASAVALNNDGDTVRLIAPGHYLVETTTYGSTGEDISWSKTVDGGDGWTRTYPPSPAASNAPGATPTPTPTATVTSTPTATATTTPGVFADHVALNEFMPDPAADWNGDGTANQDDEYIELYNGNDNAVDVSGWRLDDMDDGLRAQPDGSAPYTLPVGSMIPAHGFLLVFASESNLALNNGGDWVRLLRPDGVVVEAFAYTASRDDEAYSKTVDGGDGWTRTYPPSPGASNAPGATPTPTPTATVTSTPVPVATTVRLNEVLPSPRDVDWDGNGVPSYLDEWIELVNLGDVAVSLAGWRLVDERPQQQVTAGQFTFPADAAIAARGYLLVFRGQSGLALDASAERLRLLYPDGSEADTMQYTAFAGYDQAWCRWPDGTGEWWQTCVETPGQPNQPDATPTPVASSGSSAAAVSQPYDRFNYDLMSIAAARGLPDRTRLTLEGQVTVLPNVFDDQQIYIQDASGGILVYLRSGEWPPLSEGQWVRVNGRLDSFYGEREIALTRIDDIKTMQPAAPPTPVALYTGDVSEAREGQLVQLSASVTGFWREDTLYLDDGTGEARILLKTATGVRRPYVVIGEPWTIVGIVSQSDDEAPFDSGYRLLPRQADDLQEGRVTASRASRTQATPRALASTRTRASASDAAASLNRAPLFLPVTGARLTIRPPIHVNLRQAWLDHWW